MNKYALFGLEEYASEEDIKRSYKRLAKKYHPDLNKSPDAEVQFKNLGIIYADLMKNVKHSAPVQSHSPKEDFSNYEKYFRIIDPKPFGNKKYAEIFIGESNLAFNTKIFCMIENKEFIVTLPMGTSIPKTLEITNIGTPLILKISKKYE